MKAIKGLRESNMAQKRNGVNNNPVVEWPVELEEAHARMRARDAQRIASGEATPQQIQNENSLFSTCKSFRIVKLGI
ncbi:MAG: hypothetical protein K1X53_11940 [Candidatus Sumerlaeaceae bacterium]|nr:hypothetical protein [Candidatus Sumerlaeaceae bacterium]